MTVDEFFKGFEESRIIFDVLRKAIEETGRCDIKVSKSQIAFKRKKIFARVWIPDRYLKGKHAPLVITLAFKKPENSTRWKEIVEPYPGRFIHHLELFSPEQIDGELSGWLRKAGEEHG